MLDYSSLAEVRSIVLWRESGVALALKARDTNLPYVSQPPSLRSPGRSYGSINYVVAGGRSYGSINCVMTGVRSYGSISCVGEYSEGTCCLTGSDRHEKKRYNIH